MHCAIIYYEYKVLMVVNDLWNVSILHFEHLLIF